MAKRGLTLIETVVACGIFAGILVFVILIYSTGRDALARTSANTDPFRMAAIAQDHLKNELRGAQVICPPTTTSPQTVDLSSIQIYQPELLDSGEPRFDPTSNPPMLLLCPTPTVLGLTAPRLDGSVDLMRTGGDRGDRKLADLGPGGTVTFEFTDSTITDKVVLVTISTYALPGADGRGGQFQLQANLALDDTIYLQDPVPDDDNANVADPPPPPDASPEFEENQGPDPSPTPTS